MKLVFFDLFLFTTGYKVGPQFFRGLRSDALPQLALTVVLCVTCLATVVLASKLMGYDVGTAAGLLAGAFTESTVIGTAGDAINRLAMSEAEKAVLLNNIPVAYAVTYLFGTATIVWFLPTIGPKLMRVNLREEASRMQAALSGAGEVQPGVTSASRVFDARAYRVTNPSLANKTVAALEAMPRDARVFVVRIRRAGDIVEPEPDTVVRLDDVVAVVSRQDVLVERGHVVGPEVHDKELLDIPIAVLDVVVTNGAVAGRRLRELAGSEGGREHFRGVFLRKLARAGQEMPITPETRLDRGDVATLLGAKPDVDRVAVELGYPDWPTHATDMIFVGTGSSSAA